MSKLLYCSSYDQAAEWLGIIAEYIEFQTVQSIIDKKWDNVDNWVDENLEGTVAYIYEEEFGKSFVTFLFQVKEDAVAFKLNFY